MKSLAEIKALPMVKTATEWKYGRIYVTIKGNGGNFRGEHTSKVWIADGKVNVERGKGLCSSEWNTNLDAFVATIEGGAQ